MVSFQCEGCGDVQTKKKLDAHRNQCHAPFTCIDCMITFHGTNYRSHTSCMTEDQKYQGHLYREKPSKANKRKSVSILEPTDQNALVPHKPYVQDVPDEDDIPPEVPTPPPAVPAKDLDSVFDYMVEDGPHGTPKIMFTEAKDEGREGEMTMKNDAPSVFSRPSSRNSQKKEEENHHSIEYDIQGYAYGTEPINPRGGDVNGSALSLDFMTPAAKTLKSQLDRHREPNSASHSRTNSGSEKKRKRGQADDQVGHDTAMQDVPDTIVRSVVDTPGIIHSGLTGGLSRMVTHEDDYPFHRSPPSSPDPEGGATTRRPAEKESPGSPLKRTRRSKDDSNGLGISIKGRAGKVLSMVGDAFAPASYSGEGTMVRTRQRTSSSEHVQDRGEKRERKKHKVQRHNGTSSANVRYEPRPRRHGSDDATEPKKKLKAIEYHKHESNSDTDEAQRNGGNAQMVVFGAEERMKQRCESFFSYVTKGPHSTYGYSVNKALKRWHRDRDIHGSASKLDEEKELWKGLRLKKNDRGEIVIFFSPAPG